MARGSLSKEQVTQKILDIFDGAFLYGSKELRIPMVEDGERVEIKVTLTCAKTNVGGDGADVGESATSAPVSVTLEPPSEVEKQNIVNLMSRLGI